MPDRDFRPLKPVLVLTLLIFTAMMPSFLSVQTPPDKFLGFRVGEDRKLADYNQIKAYFELLHKESPRLTVLNIGQTTLGKDMIMAVISSEDNLKKRRSLPPNCPSIKGGPRFTSGQASAIGERRQGHFAYYLQHPFDRNSCLSNGYGAGL